MFTGRIFHRYVYRENLSQICLQGESFIDKVLVKKLADEEKKSIRIKKKELPLKMWTQLVQEEDVPTQTDSNLELLSLLQLKPFSQTQNQIGNCSEEYLQLVEIIEAIRKRQAIKTQNNHRTKQKVTNIKIQFTFKTESTIQSKKIKTHRRSNSIFRFNSNPDAQSCCTIKKIPSISWENQMIQENPKIISEIHINYKTKRFVKTPL